MDCFFKDVLASLWIVYATIWVYRYAMLCPHTLTKMMCWPRANNGKSTVGNNNFVLKGKNWDPFLARARISLIDGLSQSSITAKLSWLQLHGAAHCTVITHAPNFGTSLFLQRLKRWFLSPSLHHDYVRASRAAGRSKNPGGSSIVVGIICPLIEEVKVLSLL